MDYYSVVQIYSTKGVDWKDLFYWNTKNVKNKDVENHHTRILIQIKISPLQHWKTLLVSGFLYLVVHHFMFTNETMETHKV